MATPNRAPNTGGVSLRQRLLTEIRAIRARLDGLERLLTAESPAPAAAPARRQTPPPRGPRPAARTNGQTWRDRSPRPHAPQPPSILASFPSPCSKCAPYCGPNCPCSCHHGARS
jgi:hypothetical protein